MRFEAKLGVIIGLIVGVLLPPILGRVWPLLQRPIALSPSIFYPLFGALVIVAAWMSIRQTQALHREAVAQGQGKLNLWLTIVATLVIGAVGLWFIRG